MRALRILLAFVLGVGVLTWWHDAHAGCDCPSSPTLMCRTGRTGNTNDSTISTTQSGTIIGSTAANQNLLLNGNSTGSSGTVFLNSGLTSVPAGKLNAFAASNTPVALNTNSQLNALAVGFDPNSQASSFWKYAGDNSTTIAINFAPQLIADPPGSTRNFGTLLGMSFTPVVRQDATSVQTLTASRALTDRPLFIEINDFPLNTTEVTSVYSQPSFGAGTPTPSNVTDRRGLWYRTPSTNQSTVNHSNGVDCEADTLPTQIACLRSAVAPATDAFAVKDTGGAGFFSSGVALASLGTPAVGALRYCTDCTAGSDPCSGSGSGTFAMRINSGTPKWKCL